MKVNRDIKQNTPEWEQRRKILFTGSILKGIMGTPRARQESIYEVIANRLTVGVDSDNEYENPMERGHRLEPYAISEFEFVTGKKVERVGICESDDNEKIANSPDGLIGENEAIEVKSMGGKNHIKLWLTNEVPDEYFWQVVQYFVVNDKLETLYFVGYNPDIPVHPLHIIEVKRSKILEDIENAKKEQELFLSEVNEQLKKLIKF